MSNFLEQIEAYTAASLTDLQLLSVFIGRSEAQSILNTFGNLADLERKEWKLIQHQTLASKEAALKTAAIFELSTRVAEAAIPYKAQLTTPDEAVAYLRPKLRSLSNEVFYVVYLNNAKMVMGSDKVSEGGATATIVDPAAVMKKAILNEAQSILLAHNHPSGSKKPSKADIHITKRIAEAGKLLGIPVADHIIIAGNSYTSLKAKGLF